MDHPLGRRSPFDPRRGGEDAFAVGAGIGDRSNVGCVQRTSGMLPSPDQPSVGARRGVGGEGQVAFHAPYERSMAMNRDRHAARRSQPPPAAPSLAIRRSARDSRRRSTAAAAVRRARYGPDPQRFGPAGVDFGRLKWRQHPGLGKGIDPNRLEPRQIASPAASPAGPSAPPAPAVASPRRSSIATSCAGGCSGMGSSVKRSRQQVPLAARKVGARGFEPPAFWSQNGVRPANAQGTPPEYPFCRGFRKCSRFRGT